MTAGGRNRIQSIDLLRGVVMVLMALDHARDYFHRGGFLSDPTNLDTTTPVLFFTRWITHFCAPVFVFLAGTSAFLYGVRHRETTSVSRFLFTRGLWLILLEVTVVNFGWTFDVTHNIFILQVIWAIGASMVAMSALVRLPVAANVAIGLALIAGHNLLDGISREGTGLADILWYAVHQQNFVPLPGGFWLFLAYPVLPWIGLMALGYATGYLYRPATDPARRWRLLMRAGLVACAFFVALRFVNLYGDPSPWSRQDSATFTLLSFLNTTKYPPSLLFLLMTIGPSLVFLALVENTRARIARPLVVIGRVPLFYYVVHIYALHLIAVIGATVDGKAPGGLVLRGKSFTEGILLDYGWDLGYAYLAWIVVAVAIYPLCRAWDDYRARNRDKHWLSYL